MGSTGTEQNLFSSYEPIAIVGIGCRLPGESFSPSKLWDLLKEGRSAQSEVPKNRFDINAWYHPDGSRPGSIHSRGGYFLSHDDHFQDFDPSFFGINPLEAASMDPQQRKLLEVVYESFESAGATLDKISGSKTSCFVGCFTHDVATMNARDLEYGDPYQMTGSDMTILSNRVNYVFNLKGPSLTVDTACSSSLYALHMACQSLNFRECDAAIVGGTNLLLGIEQHIASVRLGVLSPTSTCHTFDSSADGFGRGEGICAVYLKRLSTAIADNDPIRAVIRSTAVNANGKSKGINHPSSDGQEACIRAAYTRADLPYENTGYFECHGTGTKVGDPIEVDAVARVFAQSRTPGTPLLLGSVKTNIGHTEGASGLASVLKVVLSLENNLIPATVGVKTLNPAIDLKGDRLRVVTAASPWPTETLKRASINSFGYGGANAHCIVESPSILLGQHYRQPLQLTNGYSGINGANESKPINGHAKDGEVLFTNKEYLLVFSAHDHPNLQKNITALTGGAGAHRLADVAHTLACHRSKHQVRAFTTACRSDAGLQTFEDVTIPVMEDRKPVTIAFAFTGQGAQWAQMGISLIDQYPIVRKTIEDLQLALDLLPTPPDWRLVDELRKPASLSRVQEAALSQPLCTSLQIAITVLLWSWGIKPKAVVGHSSGEVAAAFAAGLLTAGEAVAIAYYRGIAVDVRHSPGAMMAVGLGADDVRTYTDAHCDIVVACHNSPQSVTLSGGKAAIDTVHEALVKDGIFARKLNTSNNAYHSHLVRDAGQYYEDCFHSSLPELTATARTSDVPMYSCITGKVLESQNDVGIGYWRKNLESPVLFTQAVASLVSGQPDVNCLIEIGPHSALAGPIRQIRASLNLTKEDLGYLPTIIRGDNNVHNMLKLAGSLFVADFPVNLRAVNGDGGPEPMFLSDLASYQWNYDDSIPWVSDRLSKQVRHRMHPRHDLLGSRQLGNSPFGPEWRNKLNLKDVPWISDHAIGGDIIFPAAGYVAMAIEAIAQIAESQGLKIEGYTIKRLHIKAPLVFPSHGGVETLLNLHPIGNSGSTNDKLLSDFSISSVDGSGKWTEHVVGMVAVSESRTAELLCNGEIQEHSDPGKRESSDQQWYASMEKIGLCYGPSFKPLHNIHATATRGAAMARISLNSTAGTMIQESRYPIHPATLDGCLQLAVIAAHDGDIKKMAKPYLPTIIESLSIWRSAFVPGPDAPGILKSQGSRRGLRTVQGTSELYTGNGEQLAQLKVSFFSLEGSFGHQATKVPRKPYMRLVWQPDIDKMYGASPRRLFLADCDKLPAPELSKQLHELASLLVIDSQELVACQSTALDALPVHVQRYAQFLTETSNQLRKASPELNQCLVKRQQTIQHVIEKCVAQSIEAELMGHMHAKLGATFRGEVKVVDALCHDEQLTRMLEFGFFYRETLAQMQSAMKLIAHKRPGISILEIGRGTGTSMKPTLECLRGDSSGCPLYSKYTFVDVDLTSLSLARTKLGAYPNVHIEALDIDQDPLDQGLEAGAYDVIVASNAMYWTADITSVLKRSRQLLKPDGYLILNEITEELLPISYLLGALPNFLQCEKGGAVQSPFLSKAVWNDLLPQAGFSGSQISLDDAAGDAISHSIIVAKVGQDAMPQQLDSNKDTVWLIYKEAPHPLLKEIEMHAQGAGIQIYAVPFLEVSNRLSKGCRVIMAAELDEPLLARMTNEEMNVVKHVFTMASSVIWVTNGGLLQGKRPEHSLISGMAKSIMTEVPSVRISSIDLDLDTADYSRSVEIIVQHELDLRKDEHRHLDTQLIEHGGIVYISRYVADPIENDIFARQLDPTPEIRTITTNLELAFGQVGRTDSFYFKEKASTSTRLQNDQIMIIPSIYSLGPREAVTLRGTSDEEHFHNVSIGSVRDVGTSVTKFAKDDRVLCLTPGSLESSFISTEDACELLHPSDDMEGMAVSLIPYCTALYALNHMTNATSEHTILIHEMTEVKYVPLVHIAKLLGSKVIISFHSEANQALFHENHSVLRSCDSLIIGPGFLEDLNDLTKGHGIDIAIAAASSPMLPDVWSSLAINGRLVSTGDSKAPNLSSIDPSMFLKGASFMAFDMNHMIRDQLEVVMSLVRRVLSLLRSGCVPSLATGESFDVSDFPEAVAAASQSETGSNFALKYRPDSQVPVELTRKLVEFSNSASYLLVGCLGGLGRSFATWMFRRGARHFIFLSRSGADKPEAAAFIGELETMGAQIGEEVSITIAKGDVAKRQDVDRAVALGKYPIRGVMQQAMFVNKDLFAEMSLSDWQAVLNPKVQGSINLHEALIDEPLDFFVMTSSVLGATGVATQSNYAAANAFLDNLARHRWSMGLQACSIALGMVVGVGHVDAHPDVEDGFRRNGVYGIPEDEYLQMMETACRRRDLSDVCSDWDSSALSHLVTGFEPTKLTTVKDHSLWLEDNRFRHIALSTAGNSTQSTIPRSQGSQTAALLLAAADAQGETGVKDCVQDLLADQLSKLILIPKEKLLASLAKTLSGFGMDSMTTAELRSWAWKELRADIPFMALLEGNMSFSGLVDLLWDKMDSSIWKKDS